MANVPGRLHGPSECLTALFFIRLVAEGAAGAFRLAPEVRVEVGGGDERAVMVQREAQIGNRQAHFQEHLFVEGLDVRHFVERFLAAARNDSGRITRSD